MFRISRSLVVDDEFSSVLKLKVLLSEYGVCDTETSPLKAQTLFTEALLKKKPYTIITIDIDMPEINGIDLLKFFIDEEDRLGVEPSIKFMISSSGTKSNVLKAAQNSCDGFILKPAKRDKVDELLKGFGFRKLRKG